MKSSKRDQKIRQKLSIKNKKFTKILQFLKDNQQCPKSYRLIYLKSMLSNQNLAKAKIRTLFVNSINAAGGNNLSLTGSACKKFINYINKIPNKRTISVKDFLSVFPRRVCNWESFFNFMSNKSFTNFRYKKAALFLKDLDLIQRASRGEDKIFSNYSMKKWDLMIPLDIVICTCLNKIFGLKGKFTIQPRDFVLINSLFKQELGISFMLIEDMWYWGYFNLAKDRGVEFNTDKFYSDLQVYPNEKAKKKLIAFNKLIA